MQFNVINQNLIYTFKIIFLLHDTFLLAAAAFLESNVPETFPQTERKFNLFTQLINNIFLSFVEREGSSIMNERNNHVHCQNVSCACLMLLCATKNDRRVRLYRVRVQIRVLSVHLHNIQ